MYRFSKVGEERARVIHESCIAGNGHYWKNDHVMKQAVKAVKIHKKKNKIKTDEDRELIGSKSRQFILGLHNFWTVS